MTNNREEQIYKAADKATYQTPPQYSELVHKSRKAMCAYEVGFIDGCVWADSNPHWIPVEERLPEVDQRVWIFTADGRAGIARYDKHGFNVSALLLQVNVTHWMEIQPPKNDE